MSLSERHLRRVLRLAARGRFRASPNPRVGTVVVRDGEVVGEGHHEVVGGPHAEAVALAAAGEQARGADLYVNLEPCDHHGRTPPCSTAVIAAGVRRVIACHRDPNPPAQGGFARLRAAGVEVVTGSMVEEAVRLNWRFLVAALERRPAVTLKWAMSLDGKIATVKGDSQWISSPGARQWALRLREENDAILVGIGTALADDPRLDRRLDLARRPNLRVILDRGLRLPPSAKLFEIPGEVLIYTALMDEPPHSMDEAFAARRRALEARGGTVVGLTEVTPAAVLADLYARGVTSLLVEGGAQIHAAFLEAGLFDRVTVDVAPLLVGGHDALGPLGGAGFPRLADAPRLDELRLERRDGDVILKAWRARCLPELYARVAD